MLHHRNHRITSADGGDTDLEEDAEELSLLLEGHSLLVLKNGVNAHKDKSFLEEFQFTVLHKLGIAKLDEVIFSLIRSPSKELVCRDRRSEESSPDVNGRRTFTREV